jgi:uncharacterized protein
MRMIASTLVLLWVLAQVTRAAAPAPDWRATVREFAASHFHLPAWGYPHCERDYALARTLAAADHVTLDDDVLYAAAYLHDMAAFAPWAKEKLDHTEVAADTVDTVLKDTGFPMQKIDAVRGAIRTHTYDREPRGPGGIVFARCRCARLAGCDRRGAHHRAGGSEWR